MAQTTTQENNYSLGRGKIYFDPRVGGNLTGERYFGSTSAFSLNVTSETLDHYGMEEGLRTKDETVLMEILRNASLTTDNISVPNVALFMLGDENALTVTGGAVVDYAIGAVIQDRYYQLGQDLANNDTGARNVSAVTIKEGATVFTVGDDYTVDLAMGRIYIVPGGAIVDGTVLTADYTEASYTRDQIISSKNNEVEGALRFISYNATGPQRDYYMASVKITPNGDQSLKGDEWQQLAFGIEIIELDINTPAIIVDGRPYNPA